MKHVLLCVLILFPLSVCGCNIDSSQNQVSTNTENGKEQTKEPEEKQGQGENEAQGENETLEIEQQIENPPETEPVETEPVEPVETEPVEAEPAETEPEEAVTPDTALLEINELRTEYLSFLNRPQFIEFKVKAAGNLDGISLYIFTDALNPFVYHFPAVDVAAGEYITLHLQTLEKNCVDELTDNLSLSAGNESCPTARDLWLAGTDKLLYKSGTVYLLDANGNFLDAIIMNENPAAMPAAQADIAENLCNCGAWQSGAVDTSAVGNDLYISVCRDEGKVNTHSAKDWYITAVLGLSPGLPNQ